MSVLDRYLIGAIVWSKEEYCLSYIYFCGWSGTRPLESGDELEDILLVIFLCYEQSMLVVECKLSRRLW